MKSRLISALLVLAMLIALLPAASLRADALEIPDGWSHDALTFAVENGILQGDANGSLRPDAPITRAEMATILVRLLNLTEKADLSAFTDVKDTAWYADALSKAVAAGIFNGVSSTRMAPNADISREQAMTAYCRALGMTPTRTDTYMAFRDADRIAAYARAPISMLYQLGGLRVIAGTELMPRQSITRAEFAQMIYNTITCIASDPHQLPTTGKVLYNGTEPLPDGCHLDGSLYLTGALPEVHGTGLTVTGCLSAGRVDVLVLEDAQLGGLQVSHAGSSVTVTGSVGKVVLTADESDFTGPADELYVLGAEYCSVSIIDTCRLALFERTTATVAGRCYSAHVVNSQLACAADFGTLFVYDSSSSVSGYAIYNLVSYASEPNVSCNVYRPVSRAGTGAGSFRVDVRNPAPLLQGDSSVSYTASVSGGDSYGLYATVSWYAGDRLLHSNSCLMTGDTDTQWLFRSYHVDSAPVTDSYRVVVTCGDSSREYPAAVTTDPAVLDYANALSTVQTVWVPLTCKNACRIYTDRSLTNVRKTVPAGSTLYLEYNPPGEAMQISEPGSGAYGWIWSGNVTISTKELTDSAHPYSDATAEGFVDKKGYSSKTKYLIWCSRKCQRVYVFKGSTGSWKVERSFLCSSGKNSTPTPRGTFTTQYSKSRWNFDSYFVYHPVIFNGGHAFHSVLYNYNGTLQDGTVGVARSHGCPRLKYEDSKYIYGLPLNTTVIIY